MFRRLSLAAAVVVAAGACTVGPARTATPGPTPSVGTSGPRPTSTPTPGPHFTGFPNFAVTARGPKVTVFDRPEGKALRSLANPNQAGAALTFLLKAERGDWLDVYLPVRPNGSHGWVRLSDVTVAGVNYRVDVLRAEHQLKLYKRGRLAETFSIAVGRAATPTPGGLFYLAELLIPTNAHNVYGPFAYGLSGFSNTLRSFNGGQGVIGLHGTNDDSSIGHDVSHGCIRLHNADITRLAHLLPLGTPVRIVD